MRRLAAVPLAALALVALVSAQGLRKPEFFPPRLKTTTPPPQLPPLPSPHVTGGGEVMIEALVDRHGAVLRPAIVRATPPFTQFVLDAIAQWQFEPARDIDYKGLETTVEMPITVIAVYRPPILANAPTVGEPPRDWSRPSGDAPYPIATAMPNYPPNAREGGVVLFELTLDETGAVTETRSIGSTQGFESASREALASWRFKGGLYRARPVRSTAYVLFAFRAPVGLPALPAVDPNKDPYKPEPQKPAPVDPFKPKPAPADPFKPAPAPADPYKPEPSKPGPADPYKPDYKPVPQKPRAALVAPASGVLSFR